MATETDLLPFVTKLESIVAAYKAHERLDTVKPPKHVTCWAPGYGHLKVTRDQYVTEGIFSRCVVLGVQIGSRFGEPHGEMTAEARTQWFALRDRLRAELRAVLVEICAAHGGFLVDTHGSAYGVFGWCPR